MKTFLIGYDLNKTGQDYSDLIKAIKDLADGWWHHLDSTWIIRSNTASTGVIREYLKQHIDGNDELIVIDITNAEWSSAGFNSAANQWLNQNLRDYR